MPEKGESGGRKHCVTFEENETQILFTYFTFTLAKTNKKQKEKGLASIHILYIPLLVQ